MTHETYERSQPISDAALACAARYGIAPDVHPDDSSFHIARRGTSDETAALEDYYKGGADAANWLKRTIGLFRPVDEPFDLLEFAAGYGPVSRHISALMPTVRHATCEIDPAAATFLETLGLTSHPSASEPQTFSLPQKFDVIVAMSFFTHLPKATWTRWLRALLRHLKPDGCLIFTAHGAPSLKVMSNARGRHLGWDEDGFWFEPAANSSLADDCSTAASLRYIQKQIDGSGAALFHFLERAHGCEDAYIVRLADAADFHREVVVRKGRMTTPRRALARHVTDATDCIFYHSMEVPGHGEVQGQWDLRGSERDCLGGVELAGRSVLEIGPASGYLTFWMERQGAHVTSFDLDDTEHWDLVPFAGRDPATIHAERGDMIRRVNNAWWFTRAAMRAKAECVYGTAYDVDDSLGKFDVVTINSVLLHLRDPFLAVERAAARCRRQIVITDVSERQFAAGRSDAFGARSLQFIPSAAAGGPDDGWWYIPSTLLVEYLTILGFTQIEVREFKAKFQDGHGWDLYTVVGTRP